MARLGLNIGPGAMLLAAYLYFIGGGAALAAFFTAALAHELGHLLVMALTGAQIRKIELTAAGPVIEYAGCFTPAQEAGIVAAGPLAGLLFAALCFALDTPYFRYAGLVAALGSAFNLLPAYPLDGGRLARLFLEGSIPAGTARLVTGVLGGITAVGVGALGVLWRAPVITAAGILLLANALGMR